MKKVFMSGLILSLALLTLSGTANAAAAATEGEGTYFGNMGRNFKRGFVNMISSPLEIPITVKQYHYEKEGAPVLRHFAGIIDGSAQTALRLGSGAYDVLVAFIPGEQDVAPLEPGTLFEGDAWTVQPIRAPAAYDSSRSLEQEQHQVMREQIRHREDQK